MRRRRCWVLPRARLGIRVMTPERLLAAGLLDVELPEDKFLALIENEPRFRRTWDHRRPDLFDQSFSCYDMSLIAIAIRHRWTDGELVALIVAHRWRYRDTSGKGQRPDYLARTLHKVHLGYADHMIQHTTAHVRALGYAHNPETDRWEAPVDE